MGDLTNKKMMLGSENGGWPENPESSDPQFNVIQRINCLFLRIASQAGKVVQFFGENPSLKRRIPPH